MSDFNTSKLREHAAREMRLLGVPDNIQSLVLRILKTIYDSGEDEYAIFGVVKTVENLYGFLPMSPIEDKEEEWTKVEEEGVPFEYVHERCPRVFKTFDGKVVDILRVAVKQGDRVFFDERSVQYVNMPYSPVTEMVEE